MIIKNLLNFIDSLINKGVKNAEVASMNMAYQEKANTITHGIGTLLSIIGLFFLLYMAFNKGSYWHIVSFSIYGSTLVILYLASTIYHGLPESKTKKIFQVFDHSAMDQIPADYLIIGSITDFGRRATGKVGIFSRTQKQTAYAKVNVRLVDVRTGQIIYGETGEGEAFSEAGTVLGAGSQAGYDSTLNDKAIDAAISKLVVNISNNLLNNPWRSYILSQQDGIWMLAGGKTQGIKVGDVFTVKLRGDTVINPQTKLPIELPGTNVARLRVIQLTGEDLQSEISFCELLDGEIDSGQLNRYFVTEDEQ